MHHCSNCGKPFISPVIDGANFRCPHCSYHYTDNQYDEDIKHLSDQRHDNIICDCGNNGWNCRKFYDADDCIVQLRCVSCGKTKEVALIAKCYMYEDDYYDIYEHKYSD